MVRSLLWRARVGTAFALLVRQGGTVGAVGPREVTETAPRVGGSRTPAGRRSLARGPGLCDRRVRGCVLTALGDVYETPSIRTVHGRGC
jgi:hypothetical protein